MGWIPIALPQEKSGENLKTADVVLPDAARLKSAGHPTTASILCVLPAFVLVAGLIALLPGDAPTGVMAAASSTLMNLLA